MKQCSRSVVLLAWLAALTAAGACPYSIRDSGFIVRDPRPYEFAVLPQDCAAGEVVSLRAELRQAASKALDHSNVVPRLLDGKQDAEHPLVVKTKEGGATCADGEQIALLSPDAQLFPLSAPNLRPDNRYQVLLKVVVESPARERIVDRIIDAWCVVLLVEGADEAQNRQAAQAIATAAKQLVGFKPEMGEKIKAAPPLVTVKWNDPAEALLRWSLELDNGDRQAARAAVLFGQVRRVGAVLPAKQITAARLTEIFQLLGKNCTCTADPSWLLGPAVPLNWGMDLQARVRESLGFDPNSPAVASTLSGVWKTLRSGEQAVPGETVPDPATGYVEFGVQEDKAPPPQQADPDEGQPGEGDEGAGLETRTWRAAAWIGGVMAATAAGGAAVVYWLHRGRA